MGLSTAVQGSNRRAQRVTWEDELGNPIDLTGSTVTGKKHPHDDASAVVAVDGTLALVAGVADNNEFDWTYGTVDIGTVGVYIVQFFATYADTTKEKSLKEEFKVKDALDV